MLLLEEDVIADELKKCINLLKSEDNQKLEKAIFGLEIIHEILDGTIRPTYIERDSEKT